MRSLHPIPDNPWPHDMLITVEDGPNALLELLWIREAWRLEPAGDDLPPLLVDTPSPAGEAERAAAPIAQWETAWYPLWRDCLAHAAAPQDDQALKLLGASPLAPAERERLIAKVFGPSWVDRFGLEALNDEYMRWQDLYLERRRDDRPRTRDEQPEWMALDRLIPAWEAGLTTIVQIPCQGTFTRAIGPHALLVTAETRASRERYREALALFR